MEVRYCKYCGEPFLPRSNRQKMCGSEECWQEYRRIKYQEYRAKNPRAPRKAYDIPERECIVCGKTYKPTSVVQKICGSYECQREMNRRYRQKRYGQMPKREEKTEEEKARKEAFDKLVREEGWRYGEIQAQKTLAMVEPIKLTLDEPKGEKNDNSDNNGSNSGADRICNRMFQAWLPRGDE